MCLHVYDLSKVLETGSQQNKKTKDKSVQESNEKNPYHYYEEKKIDWKEFAGNKLENL